MSLWTIASIAASAISMVAMITALALVYFEPEDTDETEHGVDP